ncbi:mismatch-specific DNA-glycosylase [Caldibacillus lycopersici]|uniref:Mismatch-specific DNA-glycosylase n=1 Tax=Perspicuibacillus lycopersici TaxID=1325689 RepID=A0AAE3LMG4_9BACI|nr:mismatch-specific DNA-glycosylase [Perspicuibacillus lycopersici]MCU9613555.1 mismatch-specific DNA-glycosylase [Perspicuibacillus lycopersici]
MLTSISDHLKHNLDIIFVGFNPSLKSGELGHHYANPNNRFWKLLFESGLTPRKYAPEEDAKLLELGYGLTNIVSRPTKAADEITKEEYQQGRILLKQKIEYYSPLVVCFVGKGVYQQYSGKMAVDWGRQAESVIENVIDFVAPSSSGLVRMKQTEILSIYIQLKKVVEERKALHKK